MHLIQDFKNSKNCSLTGKKKLYANLYFNLMYIEHRWIKTITFIRVSNYTNFDLKF